MIVLIDNYDSFTWNLWHFLSDLGVEVKTIRNDVATCAEILAMNPHGIVISPGPGVPGNAGMIEELIRAAAGKVPLLGVCLGNQAICTAFGGTLTHFTPPMHGKLSRIQHDNTGVFEGLKDNFIVTRYHSLIVDEKYIPDVLSVNARTEDGKIMGLQHKEFPIFGVKFHPESIASSGGYRILCRFLEHTGINNLADNAAIDALEAQLLKLDEKFPEQVHV